MLRAMQRKKKAQQRFEEMKIKRKSTFGSIDEISEEEANRRISLCLICISELFQ